MVLAQKYAGVLELDLGATRTVRPPRSASIYLDRDGSTCPLHRSITGKLQLGTVLNLKKC